MRAAPPHGSVALVTLGCARNEVDSEELAGRLARDGYSLVDDVADADAVLVNTCGFVEAAKKDSVDTLLDVAEHGAPVVAVGCLAERYGAELAEALPEAAAVLSFDDYGGISSRVADVLAGREHTPHTPSDRRRLLPLAPVERPRALAPSLPGHGQRTGRAPSRDTAALPADRLSPGGPRLATDVVRRRLSSGPTAPLKLASGCDRRCSFCAIPSFRGAFTSRPPADVLAEARWLADAGAVELLLVSENSTSYGKDLADPRALETLLPALAAVPGVARVRLSYLQPAEVRPGLLDVVCGTPGVAPYLDLSVQHASGRVLRRMRRFGDGEQFLGLLAQARRRDADVGVRSNVIVGFPGETEADLRELEDFLSAARLDAVGVFGYSDEDGTEAASLPDHVDPDEVAERVARVSALVQEVSAQRAEDRLGAHVQVLVEEVDDTGATGRTDGTGATGRTEHQGPESDGVVRLLDVVPRVGQLVTAQVVGSDGVDLRARPLAAGRPTA